MSDSTGRDDVDQVSEHQPPLRVTIGTCAGCGSMEIDPLDSSGCCEDAGTFSKVEYRADHAPTTIEDMSEAEVAALGDVVIVVRRGGRAGVAYIRGHKASMNWIVDYGTKDDPPNTIRHLAVQVGWLLKAWRGSGTDARREIAEGSPEWQELHRV